MEFGCLIQLVSSTKINHSTRVTTLHLNDSNPLFYSAGNQSALLNSDI